jgi:hypothetical protein
MNASYVNEWLAIEKYAEIEVATLDWGFLSPPPGMAIVEEEKKRRRLDAVGGMLRHCRCRLGRRLPY